MIGINAIGTHLPATRIDNTARAAAAGKTADFIEHKIGFRTLTRKAPAEGVIDLCIQAFRDLQVHAPIDAEQVDCVILCTQNPDHGGLPHNSAQLQSRLGLSRRLAAFDISLGCSGYVYGLSIAKAFMEANQLKCGLLFTADPYSKIIAPGDWDTDLLFGDGAAVTLLTRDPKYSIRAGLFGTDGSLGHSIARQGDGAALRMLGSNVFKFCLTEVPAQILAYCEREALTLDDFDFLLLHQGSRFIVESLTNKLGLDESRVPFGASETGNLVSSSIPFLLKARIEDPAARRLLLSGFGVGLSWGTIVIERNGCT